MLLEGGGVAPMDEREIQLDKIDSLGLLARGLAHDFNNLLMAILGNTDMALSVVGGPEEADLRVFLEEIESASQRAVDHCRRLLAYAGRGRFRLIPLDLNWVIEENEAMLTEAAAGCPLTFDLASELPSIEGDAAELRDALVHLVSNAAEASSEGRASIRVTTGLANDDPRLAEAIVVGSDFGHDYVFVEVADSGVGMEDETRRRAFDPFFSTKPSRKGLGLADVFGAVRTHCGRVHLESAPEEGTEVRCYLPAMRGRRPLAERSPFSLS